ncbi:MAG: hypothetical protein EKK45_21030 [Curvibacter sp.]|nr:MAG: hypothetical protein EKK45_21030 [Curvibacter sp.]
MTADIVLEEAALAPAVIDIEASGFGRGSYPIEVGFVLPDGEAWCSLVRPEPGWVHWDPTAEQVHRITQDCLQRHGRSCREIAELLNRRLRGLTVYTDGWAHDYSWMGRLYEAADLLPSFRLDNLFVLLDDARLAHWDDTRQQVAQRLQLQRHRASADARVLQETVRQLGQKPLR